MSWLAIILVKSSLVLGAALVASAAPWISAACKHLLLLCALACLPLLLLVQVFGLQTIEVPVPELVATWVVDVGSSMRAGEDVILSEDATSWSWAELALAGYLMVALLFAAHWIVQIVRTHKWVRSTVRVEASARGDLKNRRGDLKNAEFTLRQTHKTASPFVWGFFPGAIILPDGWRSWPQEKILAVLTHEMAHLRRHDVASSLAAIFVCCVFWFHPLVWLVRRKMLMQAELACDDRVLATGIASVSYAQELINMTRSSRNLTAPAMASSNLEKRVRALLNDRTRRNAMSKRQIVSILMMMLIVVPLSGLTAREGLTASIQTDGLSKHVFEQLSASQARIEAEDLISAQAIMEEVSSEDDLSGNEQGQVHNMLGYIAFLQDDYPQAIHHYEQVVQRAEFIPAGLQITTLYTLAQLNFVVEHYERALEYIGQWMDKVDDPGPIPQIFMGQTLYQMDEFEQALEKMEKGIALAEERKSNIPPAWLKLRDYLQVQLNAQNSGVKTSVNDEFMHRVGRNVDGNYMPILKVAPLYPIAAKKNGVEGYVLVEFTVNRQGKVADPVVIESKPTGVFDQAALNSIRRFKYKPRILDGSAVEVAGVRNRILFKLDAS